MKLISSLIFLGATYADGFDGNWMNQNGDTIQIFNGQMMIFGNGGSFMATAADVTEINGISLITYDTKNGGSNTGVLNDKGNKVHFAVDEEWFKDFNERDVSSTEASTTLLPIFQFDDWAQVYTDADGNKLMIVDSENGSVSIMAFDAAGNMTQNPTEAEPTLEANGEFTFTFVNNAGATVTATVTANSSQISFAGGDVGAGGTVWENPNPPTTTVAPVTTTAATTVATTTTVAGDTTTTVAGETTQATTTVATTVSATTTVAVTNIDVILTTTTVTGGIGGELGGGAGTGGVIGDPHVHIKNPNEEAICFDFNVQQTSMINLLHDSNLDLQVTGKFVAERKKLQRKNHSHIEKITVKMGKTVMKIGVKSIWVDGVEYSLSTDTRIENENADLEIISHLRARHQGVIITQKNGPKMHISVKDTKDTLRFEMMDSRGISSNLDGLIGLSIRPKDYHISDSGSITVGDRTITTATRTWMEHAYCHVLEGEDVFTFLGHHTNDFIVLPVTLIPDNVPK